MKIAIAGSRDYTNYDEASKYIDMCIRELAEDKDIIILSGRCRGADLLGERYANEHGYKTELFPARWDRYGKTAGIIRNKEMVNAADCIICFWDGKSKGTGALINLAQKAEKTVFMKMVHT